MFTHASADPDGLVAIDEYLAGAGYETVEDWARDSDYEFIEGEWYDRYTGRLVDDIRVQLLAAIGYI